MPANALDIPGNRVPAKTLIQTFAHEFFIMKYKGRISFQGQPGAFADLACRSAFPTLKTLPCPSFEDAFRAVREKRATLAMIPVDNTIAGRVADVHRLIPEGGLFIVGEHFERIRHALLAIRGTKLNDLRHVHSHVHAIPQCSRIIRRLKLESHIGLDTAGAAKFIAEQGDRTHAAIGSALAAKIYGLDILKNDIQDADHNTTRFLVLARKPDVPPLHAKAPVLTSLVFRVRNIPAALYKALGGFATNGINMAKIESYVDEKFQAAQFYCEVEGHPDSRALKLALEELAFFAQEVRLLGTYKAHPQRRAYTRKTTV